MKKKKKITLMIIGILLVALIAVGTSYAYWKLSIRQESTNRYTSASCFNVSINLDDSPITLNNAKPISNEEGLKLEPFIFSIENTCDMPSNYSIQLNFLEESTLNSNYIKYSLEIEKVNIVGMQNQVEAKINNAEAYELKTGTLLRNETKVFELRLWLDQYTPQTEGINKILKAKVVVDAIANKELIIGTDNSGAEPPKLDNGLIPVIYNGEKWVKADITKEWYNYDKQIWANAVTVSASSRNKYELAEANTPIEMNNIETMWVWVPRYEYQHTNLGNQYAGGTSAALPEAITVNFISKDITVPSSSNFIIHDAFWWDNNSNGIKEGGEQLSGIWVAKFEMSTGSTTCVAGSTAGSGCDLATINPQIKPNVTSWVGARIGTFWTAIHNNMNGTSNTYGLTNSDVHLMKNMEWGAVAYLSQSKYGKYGNLNYTKEERIIYPNKSSDHITGRSNGMSDSSTYNTQVEYSVPKNGTGASTTGNIYGIYDMSGGSYEYVMGVMKASGSEEPAVGYSSASSGWSGNSGWNGKVYDSKRWTEYTDGTYGPLKEIEKKYYDLYKYGTEMYDFTRYHKGDATYEVARWYWNDAWFLYNGYVFFGRGGAYNAGQGVGIFDFYSYSGSASTTGGGRPVLVAQP